MYLNADMRSFLLKQPKYYIDENHVWGLKLYKSSILFLSYRKFEPTISCVTKDSSTIEQLGKSLGSSVLIIFV